MSQFIAPIISALALIISAVTAYLTLFRRGTIRMTQPTVIFFGPDGGPKGSDDRAKKVFLRTLLYADSKRGRIVENMFVRMRRNETRQNFNIWVYGDEFLARRSGIFVGENGVACNHHFLLPTDGASFQFLAGVYQLEVFASLVGNSQPLKLLTTQLVVTDQLAEQLRDPRAGLYFDWGPDSQQYHPHIDVKPEFKLPPELLATLTAIRTASPGESTADSHQRIERDEMTQSQLAP